MFAEYIRLLVSRLGLPSEYDYWLREYSLNIPLKSITTNINTLCYSTQVFKTKHKQCQVLTENTITTVFTGLINTASDILHNCV